LPARSFYGSDRPGDVVDEWLRSLSLRAASADHEQAGFDAARAIDKDGGTGGAVGGSLGRSHALGFELAEPLTADGEVELVFTLSKSYALVSERGRWELHFYRCECVLGGQF
jgi:hypothetical protein